MQPGGSFWSILPFLEQGNLYLLYQQAPPGSIEQMLQQRVPVYIYPRAVRAGPILIPTA